MTKHLFPVDAEHVLGSIGLLLLVVVANLAKRGDGRQRTFADHVSAWMARRAIDAIAVIGWLVDRLFPPAVVPRRPLPATRPTLSVRA